MIFRYDINGLRAIAVIAVILFHFNSNLVPGGFVGVDVFFVISGYLMTRIIFNGFEVDSFNLLNFYLSRAKRIIPALSVMCLFLVIYGWFFLTPGEYKSLGKHIISSLLFVSNFIYWRESGYFDAASQMKWLLHTWSLSVEWQFYVMYPIFLVVLKRFFSLKELKKLIILGFALSFIISFFSSEKWPTPSYFLLPSRAWELMVGGFAYLYPVSLKEKYKKFSEWIGLIFIFSSFFIFSKNDFWPGYFAFLPVCGAYFVILADRQDSIITNNFVFQNVGKWSYSIYIWHWPISVFGFYSIAYWNVWGLFLSIIIGWVSFRLVESYYFSPVRVPNDFGVKNLFLISGSVFMISIGIVYTDGLDIDYRSASGTPKAQFMAKYYNYKMDPSNLFDMCNASYQLSKTGIAKVSDICISKQSGGVLLWGDSHMGSLSTGLRKNLPSTTPFSQLTSSGCSPSFLIKRGGITSSDLGCDYSNELAYDTVVKIRPKVVILGARNGHTRNDWLKTVAALNRLGVKKVIIIGPFPQWQPSLPLIYIKRHLGEEYIVDKGFDDHVLKNNSYLNGISNGSFVFIDVVRSLCRGVKSNKLTCRVLVEGNLIAFDYGHLTVEGSNFIVKKYIIKEVSNGLIMM